MQTPKKNQTSNTVEIEEWQEPSRQVRRAQERRARKDALSRLKKETMSRRIKGGAAAVRPDA